MRKSVKATILCVAVALSLVGCTSTTNPISTPSAGGGAAVTTPSAPDARIEITPAASESVAPTTPIVVKVTDGTLDSVTVTNPAKGSKVSGDLSADKTTWTSKEPLAYGTAYDVAASATNASGKKTERDDKVNTLAPKAQAYPSFIPAPS